MKPIYLVITLYCLLTTVVSAQYNDVMLNTINKLDSADTMEKLISVSNDFERIEMVNQKEWLPNYYTSYTNAKMTYFTKDDKKKDLLLDKSQAELEKAIKNNGDKDELLVLQAYIHQARFSVNSMSRLSLNDKILGALNEAIEKNTCNPRAYLLLGMNTYKMPAFIGGGVSKAKEHFIKADEKFKCFTPKSKLHPNWGKELNDIWLERCGEKQK